MFRKYSIIHRAEAAVFLNQHKKKSEQQFSQTPIQVVEWKVIAYFKIFAVRSEIPSLPSVQPQVTFLIELSRNCMRR